MTTAPQASPRKFDGIDEVMAILRESGGRVSSACRLTLNSLFAADGPVSAQFIAEGRDGREVPLDTASVYRNLERLEELGVVGHVHLGHGPGLYFLLGSGSREFLVCRECTRVTSVEPEELDSIRIAIRERFGYEARFEHFPIIGLCPACASAESQGHGDSPMQDHQHSHGGYVHAHRHEHGAGHEHTPTGAN